MNEERGELKLMVKMNAKALGAKAKESKAVKDLKELSGEPSCSCIPCSACICHSTVQSYIPRPFKAAMQSLLGKGASYAVLPMASGNPASQLSLKRPSAPASHLA